MYFRERSGILSELLKRAHVSVGDLGLLSWLQENWGGGGGGGAEKHVSILHLNGPSMCAYFRKCNLSPMSIGVMLYVTY